VQEAPKWLPDGDSIVYDSFQVGQPTFSLSIWVMRADGSGQKQLTHYALDVEPVFSPDGTKIAFGRITGGSPEGQLEAVYVINTDGTGLHQLDPARAGLEHPDWSTDGRSITFNIEPGNAKAPDYRSVLSIRPDGNGLRVIQPRTPDLKFFKAVWSPDGRKLLTGCRDVLAKVGKICVVSPGRRVAPVVSGPTDVNFPSWGPDD
jgi:TolB protein